MLTLLEWFFLAFGVFRFTHLVVYDEIASFIRKPFHEIREVTDADGNKEQYLYVKGKGLKHFIGTLLSCHWCMGIWCTIILYTGFLLWPHIFNPIIMILGVAGAAAFIEEILHRI